MIDILFSGKRVDIDITTHQYNLVLGLKLILNKDVYMNEIPWQGILATLIPK